MLWGGRSAKLPHPYKPLGLLAGPFLHRQHPFCLYQELGPSRHFPLAAGSRSLPAASDLHNFHVRSLNLTTNHSIVIYISRRYRWTPHLPHLDKYQGSYACLNLCSPESHCCSRALSRDSIPLKVPYLLTHTSD
jgi:hypothetical protein